MMDEPPVTIFVRRFSRPDVRMPLEEPGDWRSEREWPIARTEVRILYLGRGDLVDEAPAGGGEDSFEYDFGAGIASGIHWGGGVLPWGMPLDQRLDEPGTLTYTTEPLAAELEITGQMRARLFVSSGAASAGGR